MSRLFVDTNIVIDLLAKRPEFAAAAELFTLGDEGKHELFISALTVANTHFILRKALGRGKAIKVLRDLKSVVSVVDLTEKIIELALNDDDFVDFEDGLQYYSAVACGADLIITRNLKDFKAAALPVLTAKQFLKTLKT